MASDLIYRLNDINNYAPDDMCGANSQNIKIALNDNGRMKPFCEAKIDSRDSSNTVFQCQVGNPTSAICAYPYTGPLSIQNNKNFCEDGYEPSIWTKPFAANTNLRDSISNYQTYIDNSYTQATETSGTTQTVNNGKPLWCVRRVKKDENGKWT